MNSRLIQLSLVKIQLKPTLIAVGIYVLAVIALNILGVSIISISLNSREVYSGFDVLTSGAIFMGFAATTGHSEEFRLFMQNCYTRLEIYISNVLYFIVTSAIMAVITVGVTLLSDKFMQISFTILFEYIYGENVSFISMFLLVFAFNLTIVSLVYMFTLLFSRFDKKIVGYCIVLSIVVIAVAIMVAIQILSSETKAEIIMGVFKIFGFIEQEASATSSSGALPGRTTVNPSITFMVFSVVNLLISRLIIRKIEI